MLNSRIAKIGICKNDEFVTQNVWVYAKKKKRLVLNLSDYLAYFETTNVFSIFLLKAFGTSDIIA